MDVLYLTTRVRDPDKDNRGKLNFLLRYFTRTIDIPLILKSGSLTIIKWWVYASYSAHPYMRGIMGGTMSFV